MNDMSECNVADMPQDYWMWHESGKLLPLGTCEDFGEACERADKHGQAVWIFSHQGLEEFKAEIARLGD